jgi:5S rRNA maturation endonuclease (ribonuclease M5)
MATLALPGADYRGFYRQLGIELPDTSRTNVSVRCFAEPDAHRREDRDPSCSVNTTNGKWKCHGCGARGGPYDAALAKHHTPRSAIDLMIAYGLAERRARLQTARELLDAARRPPAMLGPPRHVPVARRTLRVTDRDIARWQTALSRRPRLLARLANDRGWQVETMHSLELGIDRGRITIPIRNATGQLRGVHRYQPDHTARPKMLAALGSRLGLVPHPAVEMSSRVLLVEGPPDMIAARSRGLAAIAVPGDHAWQPHWAQLLAERDVTIVMDADTQGRAAAQRIAADLAGHAEAHVVDLASLRNDGYDLTDWLLEHPSPGALAHLARQRGHPPQHRKGER